MFCSLGVLLLGSVGGHYFGLDSLVERVEKRRVVEVVEVGGIGRVVALADEVTDWRAAVFVGCVGVGRGVLFVGGLGLGVFGVSGESVLKGEGGQVDFGGRGGDGWGVGRVHLPGEGEIELRSDGGELAF